MRHVAAGLSAILLLSTLLSGATWGATAPGLYLVGYDPGNEASAKVAIQAAGGNVRRTSPELGVALVEAGTPTFQRAAEASPHVHYAETVEGIRLSGAQWNGAQWNGAQWNGAQWNGAQWNGAQWNTLRDEGAQWNGAQWNGAQWNAQNWTIQHAPKKWSVDTGSTDPGLVWQWGAWAMQTPQAWSANGDGAGGAKLCVLDSGVAWDHPDLAPNMWTGPSGEHGWNAINPLQSAYDDAGHGTHVAGIAAGAVNNAYGIAGVSNAQVMAVKVLDANGYGTEDNLAFGIVWCALHGADVALMALSADAPGPTMERALQFAADRDVLMIASAGNVACADCVAYPARDPRVVAVGALDGNLKPASFSSQGPQVEVAAPGVHVLGPLPGKAFAFGSGTSQAAGFAAGLAAYVRDADATLTASQARAILSTTARDLGAAGADAGTGSGLLQASGAVAAALA